MGTLGDLTTLANFKAYPSPPIATTTEDALTARLITAVSQFICPRYLQRSLIAQTYTETRNGTGSYAMMLRQEPIIAVTGVLIGTIPVPLSADPFTTGYTFDPVDSVVYLRGYSFWRGAQNVQITYMGGFLVSGETQTVPASPAQLVCTELAQLWAADNGVAYVGGAALVAVIGSPAQGQYVPPAAPDGYYQFNTADAGAAIAVTYSYTPKDVEQACIELCTLRMGERGRIGQVSKGLAGETTLFLQKEMPASVTRALAPYRRVTPN